MIVFIVETKSFYYDFNGTHYQVADAGVIPYITTSLKRAYEMAECYLATFNGYKEYELVEEKREKELSHETEIHQWKIRNRETNMETMITIYKSWVS